MLGNDYGESKREPGPIDPVESEIIEKVVMMQEPPTKEEVDELKKFWCNNKRLKRICDAYLALREDREKLDEYIVGLVRENADLKAENQTLRAEVVKWQRIRAPTHGTCCTCQRCGQSHDDCRCDLDEVCDELDQLKAQNQALRARLGNNILEA